MKKISNLNQPLSAVVASLGYTDRMAIADAGLPIPLEVQRIDLALKSGVPAFLETVETVLTDLQVEGAILAEEMVDVNPDVYKDLREMLGETPIETVPHERVKELTRSARAVVRTGESTPCVNVILVAGVVF